ncbi:MAG: lysine--tRNA ligase [Deltaproteobacteria bacterium]|nr:MAG: lysine--tRNA ligase [Deltaproteobacteria bacterium]
MTTEDSKGHAAAYRDRLEDNHLFVERLRKAEALRRTGVNPWAHGFEVTHSAADIQAGWGERTAEELETEAVEVRVAGRIRFHRRMGKASFLKLQDGSSGSVAPGGDEEEGDDFQQVFLSLDGLGEEAFTFCRGLDLGDIVGVEGTLMRTRRGELSVKASQVTLLTKSIRPLPEKFRGLTDVEQRFRQRYVDLIMNADSRRVFRARARIVKRVREFLDARGFLEVETPMMHPTPGGAAAKPFRTHHNALDMELFLRIAPELYLKRLLVGGFERVFELNRNFRNEGLSRQHNPEFTMVEFYQAYATVEDLMDLTEELVESIAVELHGRRPDGRVVVEHGGQTIDLTRPWRRVTVAESVAEHFTLTPEEVTERAWLEAEAERIGLEGIEALDSGKLLMEVFEHHVDHRLLQPTFVTQFPASVSPLARRNDENPEVVDRFELYVLGWEIANAFNELNDPEDQHLRFREQLAMREAGDDEAMPMDEDYIRALEVGMPPAAGEGIGIDRLTMLLTGTESIREVLLFPHMRPEQAGS